VERRQDPRFETYRQVDLILLAEDDERVPARLTNVSNRGLSLLLDKPVALSAPVRIDVDDTILLGEVCRCVRDGTAYSAAILLEQGLTSVTSLNQLVAAVMGTPAVWKQPVAVGAGPEASNAMPQIYRGAPATAL